MNSPTPGASVQAIASSIDSYDPARMTVADVQAFLARLVQPVATEETVRLNEAPGRVLSREVISPMDVPPHDNSAMDGYAFDGAQLLPGQPLRLRVSGTVLAGRPWEAPVHRGECVRIMTGAMMPPGLDTVVPLELAETLDAQTMGVASGRVRPGDNRRRAGEDVARGQVALQKGERLAPAACGLLASLGIESVAVWRRLRVAFFSTGDEILSLGDAPRPGAVYDSNRYTITALLARLGVEVIDLGVVRDDPQALRLAFHTAAEQADAIITSGGVSAGDADHTRALMDELAGPGGVAFWNIAMRPGRPMAAGRMGHAMLFGLPGNPVAAMVTFLVLVRPALLQMMGSRETPAPLLRARSAGALRKKPGRTEYQRGKVSVDAAGRITVQTTGDQGSGMLSSMVLANGLIVLPHHQGDVAAGDEVQVMMFEGLM